MSYTTRLLMSSVIIFLVGCGGGGGNEQEATPPITNTSPTTPTGPDWAEGPDYSASIISRGFNYVSRIQLTEDSLYVFDHNDSVLNRLSFNEDRITTVFDAAFNAGTLFPEIFNEGSTNLFNHEFQTLGNKVYSSNFNSFHEYYNISAIDRFNSIGTVVAKNPGSGGIYSIAKFENFLFWIGDCKFSQESCSAQLYTSPTKYFKSGDRRNDRDVDASILPDVSFEKESSVFSLPDSLIIYEPKLGCFHTYSPELKQLSELRCDQENLGQVEPFIHNGKIFFIKFKEFGNWEDDYYAPHEIYSISEIDGQSQHLFSAANNRLAKSGSEIYYLSYRNNDESWFIEKYDLNIGFKEVIINLSDFLSNSYANNPNSSYYHVTVIINPEDNHLYVLERENTPEVKNIKHVFDLTNNEYMAKDDVTTLIADFHPMDILAIENQYVYMMYPKSNNINNEGQLAIFDLKDVRQIQPTSLNYIKGPFSMYRARYMNIEDGVLFEPLAGKIYRFDIDKQPDLEPIELIYSEKTEETSDMWVLDHAVTNKGAYWISGKVISGDTESVQIKWKPFEESNVSTVFSLEGSIRDLNWHGEYLYFVTSEGPNDALVHKLMRININNQNVEELTTLPPIKYKIEKKSFANDAMAFYDNMIYFPVYSDLNIADYLFSYDLSNGTLKTLATELNLAPTDMATDGEYIYFTDGYFHGFMFAISVDGKKKFRYYSHEHPLAACRSIEYREQGKSLYAGCSDYIVKLTKQ